jgi:hypothetical protein
MVPWHQISARKLGSARALNGAYALSEEGDRPATRLNGFAAFVGPSGDVYENGSMTNDGAPIASIMARIVELRGEVRLPCGATIPFTT